MKLQSPFKLRPYQSEIASKAAGLLSEKGIVYLSMEVRTGKTITALEACRLYGVKSVLFLTKLKAIDSVKSDAMNFDFAVTICNDESMHKIGRNDFDVVVHDEHHRFGAYPKANASAKLFKKSFGHLPMIFLSGTPTPESHSQWFHQFWVSKKSPFPHANFYKWAADYVRVKIKHLGYATVNDYSDADRDAIMAVISPYLITYTQAQAGFKSVVNETVLHCDVSDIVHKSVDKLKRDLFIKSKDGRFITADTGAKLQQKIHQLYSGTIKFDDGSAMTIDLSKARFIKERFAGEKIAIFYKFVQELKAMQEVFGDLLTQDMQEFRSSHKWIAYQIVSGSQGTSFKEADCLVYYNIDFSSLQYWQSRDRLTTMDRPSNDVYWIFSKGGIEDKIYRAVLAKKDYTLSLFRKDYELPNKSEETFSRKRL